MTLLYIILHNTYFYNCILNLYTVFLLCFIFNIKSKVIILMP